MAKASLLLLAALPLGIGESLAEETLRSIPKHLHASSPRLEMTPVASTIQVGNHEEPVQVMEHSFQESYLEELRARILEVRNTTHALEGVLEKAYPFQVVCTISGLAVLSEALGIPLDAFVDHFVDPNCNAFQLNAVVVGHQSFWDAPWHDFALPVHSDQSLKSYTEGHQLPPNAGAAQTVTVLYLDDLGAEGELEIYNRTGSGCPDEDEDSDLNASSSDCLQLHATLEAEARCDSSGQQVTEQVWGSCHVAVVNKVLADSTLARIRPQRGRVVQFDGGLLHSVRRVRSKAGMRVSLVLEQFAYPSKIAEEIPTLHVLKDGKPFFASSALQDRFADADGSPGLERSGFWSCLLRGRRSEQPPEHLVRGCVRQASQADNAEL